MDTREAIVKRILELCREKNITINKLCSKAGATQSTVNDIVNGITKNPGAVTIKKLCDGLEISLREFYNTDLFDNLEQEIK